MLKAQHCFSGHRGYLNQALHYSAFKFSSFALLSRSVSRNGEPLLTAENFSVDNYELSTYSHRDLTIIKPVPLDGMNGSERGNKQIGKVRIEVQIMKLPDLP